jgi:hypothetical protein
LTHANKHAFISPERGKKDIQHAHSLMLTHMSKSSLHYNFNIKKKKIDFATTKKQSEHVTWCFEFRKGFDDVNRRLKRMVAQTTCWLSAAAT